MKLFTTLFVCAATCTLPAMAQKWEFGGAAGVGFYSAHDLSSPNGTASAKIRSNVLGSIWVGSNSNDKWGGEFRYSYQRGALGLKQGSIDETMGADSHGIEYSVLYHFKDREYRVRPFVSLGGGVKIFRGTGEEVLVRPLDRVALLTKAQDLVPMVSVGAGFKVQLAQHTQLRLDVRDYLTPFPNQVITPIAGNSHAWINDIVPMVGLVYTK